MKYLIPDWDDIVDPDYDFLLEKPGERYRQDRFTHGVRIWEVFNPSPVDGVLVSISTVKKNPSKYNKMIEQGARRFLKLPSSLELMGDCGAWQYRYENAPPYTVEEVLETYEELGVDYGVALDHIPFFGNPVERLKLTYDNALKSFDLWRRGGYRFRLLASLQGIEIEDYLRMLDDLYARGYRHFAIGGLAKRDNEFIERLVAKLREKLKHYRDIERLHFLGIARTSVIKILREVDEVEEISFDNATFLRMAWTRPAANYVLPDGRVYTAIRLRRGEQDVYELLKKYEGKMVSLDEVVEKLKEKLAEKGDIEYLRHYVATLRDRPWEDCGCEICRTAGIEVVLFKGNNRNRRRGFHNVHVFGKWLKNSDLSRVKLRVMVDNRVMAEPVESEMEKRLTSIIRESKRILVLTHCTAEKSVSPQELARVLRESGAIEPSFDIEREDYYLTILHGLVKPAGEMYKGSFTPVKNMVSALRSCKTVDLYIISARYGVIGENDRIIPYNASLKGMRAVDIHKWSRQRRVVEKLMEIFSSRGYDLVICILPREYAYAVKDFLSKVSARVILIAPRSVGRIVANPGIIHLPSTTLPNRLRYVSILKKTAQKTCTQSLLKYLKNKNTENS